MTSLCFGDVFDILEGMSSGCDQVFNHYSLGNINVRRTSSKVNKCIFVKKWPPRKKSVERLLCKNMDILSSSKKKRWYKWEKISDVSSVEESWGRRCIFIKTNVENMDTVCWKGVVEYFDHSLIMLVPKYKSISLKSIVKYINSDVFRNKYIHNRDFKISKNKLLTEEITTI